MIKKKKKKKQNPQGSRHLELGMPDSLSETPPLGLLLTKLMAVLIKNHIQLGHRFGEVCWGILQCKFRKHVNSRATLDHNTLYLH